MGLTQPLEPQTAFHPLETERYLDDVALAETLLENAALNKGRLSPADIVFALRNLLKMTYYPVAIKYFFDQDEMEAFEWESDYKIAMRPYTF